MRGTVKTVPYCLTGQEGRAEGRFFAALGMTCYGARSKIEGLRVKSAMTGKGELICAEYSVNRIMRGGVNT